MSIKLLLLKSGDQVIADAKELVRKDSDKLYSYVLNKPHKVTATKPILLTEDVDNERNVEITLSPWILLTEDKEMTVPREWVITIVNPIESIVQIYYTIKKGIVKIPKFHLELNYI